MMPGRRREDRADQLATLGVICHEPDLGARHGRPAGAGGGGRGELDPWRAANLREMRRAWVHETRCRPTWSRRARAPPSACEMALARGPAEGRLASRCCRRSREVLNLMREVGEAKAAALGMSLYDALLDEYEPGGRAARDRRAVRRARAFLPDLLRQVMERQAPSRSRCRSTGRFPVDAQRKLGEELMPPHRLRLHAWPARRLGRIPSPAARADDVRITTRYERGRFRARPDGRAARDRARASTRPACRTTGAASRSARRAAWCCMKASRC